jgi:hypothetical protein
MQNRLHSLLTVQSKQHTISVKSFSPRPDPKRHKLFQRIMRNCVAAEQPGTALTDAGIWLYSAMQEGTAGWIGTMRLANSLLFKNSRSFRVDGNCTHFLAAFYSNYFDNSDDFLIKYSMA